jgi:glucose-1-phosphate adenylyltransferase
MIGKDLRILVYDYATQNSIPDYIYEVRDGKRTKILVERTRDSSYWKDVGTIDSYYETSMDLVDIEPMFNLYAQKWPLRTYLRPLPPSKFIFEGKALRSIVSEGCIISGATVSNSILSTNVVVERDSDIEQSIIFDDVIIEPNVKIRRAIIDKQVRIQADALIGYDHNLDRQRGCFVSDSGITVVLKGMDIAPA